MSRDTTLPAGSDVRGKTGSVLAEGRLGAVDLSLSAGDARPDEVDRLDLKVAAGSASVRGTVTARSAHAGIRVARVESGSVDLTTSFGSIEVGVPEGTAVWLDVGSQHGSVRNQLTPTGGPGEDDATAEVRAGTGYGDVIVRRP